MLTDFTITYNGDYTWSCATATEEEAITRAREVLRIGEPGNNGVYHILPTNVWREICEQHSSRYTQDMDIEKIERRARRQAAMRVGKQI